MGALRPRLDIVVVLNGERHDFHTTVRDTVTLKAEAKGPLTGDIEDVTKLAYLAAKRQGVFVGTWDAWLDALEDIEVNDPPPLSAGPGSPASSPQSLEA